jgi:hypothetical protein
MGNSASSSDTAEARPLGNDDDNNAVPSSEIPATAVVALPSQESTEEDVTSLVPNESEVASEPLSDPGQRIVPQVSAPADQQVAREIFVFGSPSNIRTLAKDEQDNADAWTPVFGVKDSEDWLQPAIELWVQRALKAIAVANKEQDGDGRQLPIQLFELRLRGEAQTSEELRPNDFPTAGEYIEKTIQGLRADPRLRWEKQDDDIVYWSNDASSVSVQETPAVQCDNTYSTVESPSDSVAESETDGIVSSEKSLSPRGIDALTQETLENTGSDGESTPTDPIDSVTLVAVQQRIDQLAAQLSPLDMSLLPQRYSERYGASLDYKSLGFAKLKGLIDTIASVKIHMPSGASSWFLEHEMAPKKIKAPASMPLKRPQNNTTSSGPRTTPRPDSIQRGIEKLVLLRSPLDIGRLQELYQEEYGTILDYKSLGFKRLKALVATIPSVAILSQNGKSPTMLVWRGNETLPVAAVAAMNRSATPEPTPSFHELTARPGIGIESADLTKPLPVFQTSHQSRNESEQESVGIDGAISQFTGTSRACIGDRSAASSFREMTLLGDAQSTGSIFLNTHEPFCLTAIGVQGAGKSHTLACVLESCLVPSETGEAIRLKKAMTALVLHYDQSTTSVCEAAGLLSPSPRSPEGPCVPRSKATILVSPTFYKQRKAFYGDYCTVRPLLFKWSSLTADHIKRVMRIETGANQLYVASFMTLLRGYQRRAVVPEFARFIEEVKEMCNLKGQLGPLEQRIALLESMVAESDVNKDIVDESMDLAKALSSGLDLIIVDLTDPLLSKEEANSLFQVVTEQFRSIPVAGGKILALDEAHKFMDGIQSDGLSEAIVNVARLMRHDGIRLAVSTQSPKALAPELLELVSVAVLHQFHSQDWWTYLRQKLPLPHDAWASILSLVPGNAMVFASRSAVTNASSPVMQLRIRARVTADFGASRTNN